MALWRLLFSLRPSLQGRVITDIFPAFARLNSAPSQRPSDVRNSNRQFSSSPVYSVGVKGFNRSAIEDEFDLAVQRLKRIRPDLISLDATLDLYAYYMQALHGPCTQPEPMHLDHVKRTKWSVWKDLDDMSTEEAMRLFVSVVGLLWANKSSGTPRRTDYKEKPGSDVYIIGSKQDIGKPILSKVERGVKTITINRPLRNNLLTMDMYKELLQHFEDAAHDDHVLVSLLAAHGDYFCSGTDMESLRDVIGDCEDGRTLSERRQLMEKFVGTLIDHPKLLVAVVNGPAIGIGATMLGLFDFIFCSELAVFHAPSIQHGLGPDACASHTFPLIMGPSKASEFLLLGRKLRSVDAFESRFVTRVLTEHSYDSSYPQLVDFIASLPQKALLSSHSLIRCHERARLHAVNKEECDMMEQRWRSTECREAILRYLSGQAHTLNTINSPPPTG